MVVGLVIAGRAMADGPVPAAGAPTQVIPVGVWTGSELVVWGGTVPTGGSSRTVEIKSADDGQRYVP